MSEQKRRRRRRRSADYANEYDSGYGASESFAGHDAYDAHDAHDAPSGYGTQKRRARSGPGAWIRRILLAILGLLLLVVLYKGARLGMLGFQLNQHASNLQTVARSGLGESVEPITGELQGVLSTLDSLSAELAPIQPALNTLNGLTSIGTTLAHASELTDVGRELTGMALQGTSVGAPLLQERQSGSFPTALASLVAGSTETFVALGQQAEQLTPRVEALGNAGLHPALAAPLNQGGATMGFGAALLKLAPVLPELMGTNKPATYLVIIQNNHELRATGGFITAVGQLTLDKGEIVALDFRDSYEIANHEVEHPWAPEPMQRFLGIGLMFLRDTNWSPDLPTAAQLMRTIYGLNEGVKVDGVITVDLQAVELLIGGLGQLRVEGVAVPITSDNIVEQIKAFWQDAPNIQNDGLSDSSQSDDGSADENDWWSHRKDFMPFLGEAAVKKIQAGAVDYLTLVQSLHQALEERAIQVWVTSPEAAEQLAALEWDGGLRPPADGDFIALVDSNFGFNKVDSVLERSLNYNVEWPASGSEGNSADGSSESQSATATASITYKHPLTVPGHLCDVTPRYGATYDDMASRCYFDYVRLYVPQGSQLRDVEGVDLTTTNSQPGANGTQVFSAYFIAEPGTEHTIRFRYELPPRIQRAGYSLKVRRQSGTGPLAFSAMIDLNGVERMSIQAQIEKGSYHWQ